MILSTSSLLSWMPSWLAPITATACRRSQAWPLWKYGAVRTMFRSVGTLKTYSSLAVLVTMKRPLSFGGRMLAPGFSTTPNGAYMPPPTLIPLWQLAHPRSMNSVNPSFCVGERAFASPLRKRSNGASRVIRVASKTAMAFCTLPSVIGSGSPGNAFANASR